MTKSTQSIAFRRPKDCWLHRHQTEKIDSWCAPGRQLRSLTGERPEMWRFQLSCPSTPDCPRTAG